MITKILCCAVTAAALGSMVARTAQEPPHQFEARTQWWRQAKFGMFIHWGIYAVPADCTDLNGNRGGAEWYLSNKHMQVKDYEKFAAQFNPVRFNAAQWVQIAKDAGMKYIVITSKHHDGFCLFGSQLTDYCITKATPFKRDPLRELAAACEKAGLKLCFYHSIMDWHHPDYLPRRGWEKETRPAAGASLERYLDYMKGQLRELLTHYGPIGVLWFDGGWEHNATELRSAEVNRMIRSLQPAIIINDRNQLPEDHATPEQGIPAGAMPGGRLWETCMTMNDTWGYAKNDTNWKSAEDLVRKLCDIAHKGGNFLLNVGPTAEGEIPPASVERLAQIGQWMKVNGQSIYGAQQSPFKKLPFEGRCTVKGNRLYLQVFKWPGEGLKVAGLRTPVKGAWAPAGRQKLKVTAAPAAEAGLPPVISISQPKRLDPIATVIELRLAGPPDVAAVTPAIKAGADGVLVLKAADAEIHGQTAQYEQGGGRDNIGFWTRQDDYVTWPCEVSKAGRYAVEVTYACPAGNEGSEFTVGLESGGKVGGQVKATGSWTAFKPEALGQIELPAGRQTVAVRATTMPRGAVMNLQQVRLTPAP